MTGEATNPWVSRPPAPAAAIVARPSVLTPHGPTAPQRGVPAPDLVDQLPVLRRSHPADLWCVGAHGGSGESMLASLAPGWVAAGHAWPHLPEQAGQEGPARVVLTARSSAHGLLAAQRAATQWAAGLVPDVDVLGLVVVADAPGRLPRPLRDLAHVVGGGVARTWHVPWVEAWRLGQPVEPAAAPRAVRHLIEELSALLQHDTTPRTQLTQQHTELTDLPH